MRYYAAHSCADKQAELDNVWAELKDVQAKYKKIVTDKQAEIDELKQELARKNVIIAENMKLAKVYAESLISEIKQNSDKINKSK